MLVVPKDFFHGLNQADWTLVFGYSNVILHISESFLTEQCAQRLDLERPV